MSENFTCNMPPAGDKGQRYEVRYKDGKGQERVAGWTNREDGGQLVTMVKMHPVWHSPQVVDRRTALRGEGDKEKL